MDFPPISFRFKPGQRITHEAARVLNILLERSSRSSQWEFDPADFEFNQSGGNQSVRLTGNVCCCPFDPVKKVEDDDLEEGPSYTFDTNDRTEAYVLLTTGAELVTGTLPAMADLPRPPVECWQLHLVNLSGSAWRITPPEGVLIGEGEYLDLWPGRSIVIWTDQPETGDPTAYYAEEGRYAYDPLAFTDSATLDETSFGKVTTWTASAAKTATIGDDALNTGSGQYIANLGTAPLDITPETGTIAGRSSLWLPPRQSLLTTVDDDGNVIALTGRTVIEPRTVTGTTDTITAEDHFRQVTFAGTSACAFTVDATTKRLGFTTLLQNHGTAVATYTAPAATTIDTAAALILLPRDGVTLIYDGTDTYRTIRGTHPRASREINDNYTVVAADNGFCLVFNISAAKTVTVPVFGGGFHVEVANGWNSTGKLTISTTDGAGDVTNGAVLAPRQSMGLFSNGTGYAASRGVHGRSAKTISATTYTVLIEDFGRVLNFTASANVAVTVPQFPSGFYFDIINSTADKLVAWTDAADHTGYVAAKQGIACFMDSSTTLFTQPGQTLSGLVDVDDTDFTATINHQGRLINVTATTANRTVTLDATTNIGVLGMFVMADNESEFFVEIALPMGGTWIGLGGNNPIVAAGFGIFITCDGAGNYAPFAGSYATAIYLCGTGTGLTDTFTINSQAHTALYEGRGADNITLTMPAAFAGSMWWHVNNPSVDGFKWFDIFNEDLTQQWRLSADRSTTFVSGGDGTFTELPGDMSMGAIVYGDDDMPVTLTYAHSAYAHYFQISDDATLTLDDSCALPGGGFMIPVNNSPDSEGDLIISVTTELLGLPDNILHPCQGGWIFSCNDGKFVWIMGTTCCDCDILTTTGDLITYQSGIGEVRVPVGSDGYLLEADSMSPNGLTWTSPGSLGYIGDIVVPAYMGIDITSGTATLSFGAQNANYVFAGPETGGAAPPTFRKLVAEDEGTGASGLGHLILSDTTPPSWIEPTVALDSLGMTRGGIPVRGATTWSSLVPDPTPGLPLISNGTGNSPSYGALSEVAMPGPVAALFAFTL